MWQVALTNQADRLHLAFSFCVCLWGKVDSCASLDFKILINLFLTSSRKVCVVVDLKSLYPIWSHSYCFPANSHKSKCDRDSSNKAFLFTHTLSNEIEILMALPALPLTFDTYSTTRWWSSKGTNCVMTSRSTSYWRLVCCRITPSWRKRTSHCRSRSPCSNRARWGRKHDTQLMRL